MKKIEAKVVADSINQKGDRITSFILTYPRFIHSELMTHRMFSRNSASSRAIPFKKMLEMVEEDPFIPIAWQKDHKGMQGAEYYDHTLTEEVGGLDYTNLPRRWLRARDTAVSMAKIMADERGNMPVTKQLCNRLLEPFMWHTVLVTATEYDNFFKLRCPQYEFYGEEKGEGKPVEYFRSKKDYCKIAAGGRNSSEIEEMFWLTKNKGQAEIHIMALAEAMWDAMNESIPKELKAGEWHIPFDIEPDKLIPAIHNGLMDDGTEESRTDSYQLVNVLRIRIATARCARLSYMTFDNEIDYKKDLKLYNHLLKSKHMSPFEHCAKAMTEEEYETFYKGELNRGFEYFHPYEEGQGWCDNFRGFIQHRYLLQNKKLWN